MDPLTVTAALGAVAGLGSAWQMRRRALRAEARLGQMSEELRAERYAAGHDPLTGLPNRRTFHTLGTALLTTVAAGQRLAAVVLDLDDFKMINDRFGHAAGDEVLITVAHRLTGYADGDLVARLGGDEFAGLIHDRTGEDAWLRRATHRLAGMLATPMHVAGESVRISASVGVVPVPRGVHLTEALHRADAAMYRAKARRRREESPRDAPRQEQRCRDEPSGDTGETAHLQRRRVLSHDWEAPARSSIPHRAAPPPTVARQLVDTSPTHSPDLGGS